MGGTGVVGEEDGRWRKRRGVVGVGHISTGTGGGALAGDEVAELVVDGQGQVFGHDFVHVAVPDGEAETVGDRGALGRVAVCRRDGGGGERAQVEEDGDGGGGDEFLEELDEDGGRHVADFVEEDAEAWYG